MSPNKPKVGWAGLGAMGGGMAKHLLEQGYSVIGYDVFQPLIDSFVAAGGEAASSPKHAATGVDIFVSMVANADQNSQLLFQGDECVVRGLGRDKILMLCSTTAPAFMDEVRARIDQEFQRSDIKLLDCPVSGGTLRAANGTLSIFASGADEDLTQARLVLDSLAQNLYQMGALGNGSKTKTVHQLLAATNIIAASEAMGLAACVGLNTQMVADHINQSTTAASFMFENRVPHMLASDWHPYSAVAIVLKDAGIVTSTARSLGMPTPMASAAEQLYLRGAQVGLVKDDDAKLVQLYLPPSQGSLVQEMTAVDTKMTASYRINAETIADLLAGIHLAASMECMAFGVQLGMDLVVLNEIMGLAAGRSAMWTAAVPSMLSANCWSLADYPQAHEIETKLADAVAKCQKIKFPCVMASTALQQFHFAATQQKNVRRSDHGAR